jgi:hypothetical protein
MPATRQRQVSLAQALTLISALASSVTFAEPTPAPETTPAASPPATSAERAEPREAVVILRDGRTFSGVLVSQNDKSVVLNIGGLDTTFATPKVERVRMLEPVLERYKALRASIDDHNSEQLLLLVDFLIARDKLAESVKELEALIARQPNNEGAKLKLDRVLTLVALRESEEEAAAAQADGRLQPGAAPSTDRDSGGGGGAPLLTPEQANLLKVFELDLDQRPAVAVPRQVGEEVMQKFAGDPLVPTTKEGRDALIAEGSLGLVDLMFRLRARDYYSQIRVLSTPQPLQKFREEIQQGLLLSGCATSGCHGSYAGGRLVLATRRPTSEIGALTNFLIINEFRMSDGSALLNFQKPEHSALIELALPRDQSARPHPPAPHPETGADQWRPFIRGRSDPRVARIAAWVSSIYQPRAQYSVGYTPVRPFVPEANQAKTAPKVDPK